MNKTLYEEALEDAKKLRELAEETAKNRVLESIMPQIKSIVDSRILGEQIEMDDMAVDEPEDLFDVPMQQEPASAEPVDTAVEEVEGNIFNIDAGGDVNIAV